MTKELARGRKFHIYGALMDAAIEQKVKDIFPWIKSGTIADAGFGTGALLFRLSQKFPQSNIFGLDISSHFFGKAKRQFKNIPNINLLRKNIVQQHFPKNSLDTKIFSTALHEIYSYNDYNLQFVKTALKNSFKELKPGGRIIIRDGIQPQPEKWCLWFKPNDGESNLKLHPRFLSTEAMFLRFVKEFKKSLGAKYQKTTDPRKGALYYLNSADAYEFISKKDYRDNWHLEINEQFGYLTLLKYKKLLRDIGFKIISAKSYRNPWIVKNRWKGKVKIYQKTKGGFTPLSYPDTNVVIVAKKIS